MINVPHSSRASHLVTTTYSVVLLLGLLHFTRRHLILLFQIIVLTRFTRQGTHRKRLLTRPAHATLHWLFIIGRSRDVQITKFGSCLSRGRQICWALCGHFRCVTTESGCPQTYLPFGFHCMIAAVGARHGSIVSNSCSPCLPWHIPLRGLKMSSIH